MGVAPTHQHASRTDFALRSGCRECPGFDPSATRQQPAPRRRVDRPATHPRSTARPARILRCVRSAVVRGDLPPALRLSHRMCPAPRGSSLEGDAHAAADSAAQSEQDASLLMRNGGRCTCRCFVPRQPRVAASRVAGSHRLGHRGRWGSGWRMGVSRKGLPA